MHDFLSSQWCLVQGIVKSVMSSTRNADFQSLSVMSCSQNEDSTAVLSTNSASSLGFTIQDSQNYFSISQDYWGLHLRNTGFIRITGLSLRLSISCSNSSWTSCISLHLPVVSYGLDELELDGITGFTGLPLRDFTEPYHLNAWTYWWILGSTAESSWISSSFIRFTWVSISC